MSFPPEIFIDHEHLLQRSFWFLRRDKCHLLQSLFCSQKNNISPINKSQLGLLDWSINWEGTSWSSILICIGQIDVKSLVVINNVFVTIIASATKSNEMMIFLFDRQLGAWNLLRFAKLSSEESCFQLVIRELYMFAIPSCCEHGHCCLVHQNTTSGSSVTMSVVET